MVIKEEEPKKAIKITLDNYRYLNEISIIDINCKNHIGSFYHINNKHQYISGLLSNNYKLIKTI